MVKTLVVLGRKEKKRKYEKLQQPGNHKQSSLKLQRIKERWQNKTQETKGRTVELQGKFKKLKPSMFDGESEEVAEAWLINIKGFFQVNNYDDNLKALLSIFQLSGRKQKA